MIRRSSSSIVRGRLGLAFGIALLAGGGCGTSLSYTVDNDALRDMSRQGQLWTFDAENEIVVALDQLDEAKDTLNRVHRHMRAAERSIEAAEKRNSRLGVEMAEAWLVHLEAMEEWGESLIKLQRFGLIVARAAVELAKAQVIQREDLLGGKDFSVKDFEEQYQKLKRRYDRRRKKVDKARRVARKKEGRWWQIRRRFVAQSGDNDRGLWID